MYNDCVGGAAATRPGSSPPIIRAHGKRSFQDFGLIGFITLTPGGSRCVAWLDGRPGGHAPASSKAKCPRLAFDSELVMCKGLAAGNQARRSEEHTSELQSLMRISYAVFCLKKKKTKNKKTTTNTSETTTNL